MTAPIDILLPRLLPMGAHKPYKESFTTRSFDIRREHGLQCIEKDLFSAIGRI